MNPDFFTEVYCAQRQFHGEKICGDVFLSRKVKEENRIIAVLSDGMGHGVKANVLATLTATITMNFTINHRDPNRITEIIMDTLPECSVRKMSYSTYSVADISTNEIRIIEYDNPLCLIIRNNKVFEPVWQCIISNNKTGKPKEILYCTFVPAKGDRIIFFSDGIVQSGMGSNKFPFGWGRDEAVTFIETILRNEPEISAQKLATKVLNKAMQNDALYPKDDTSCVVIYLREPRPMILSSGPPFDKNNDKMYADKVAQFNGRKVLCGATTADIISREWKQEITDTFEMIDPELPPVSFMNGVDLITEGILTLGKVEQILNKYNPETRLNKGPADTIVKMLLESDEIQFLIGTGINIAHQDPNLPVDMEIRRSVMKRIATLLEEKFLKDVKISFL